MLGEIKCSKMAQIVQPCNWKLTRGSSGDIVLRGPTLPLCSYDVQALSSGKQMSEI